MREIPKKLENWIQKNQKDFELESQRFKKLYLVAQSKEFQSPRFWSMRQIISGRTDIQIEREVLKKIKKKRTL